MKFLLVFALFIIKSIIMQKIKSVQTFIEIDGYGNNGAVEEIITYELSWPGFNKTAKTNKTEYENIIVDKLIPNLDGNLNNFNVFGIKNTSLNSFEIKQNPKKFNLIISNVTAVKGTKFVYLSYTYDIENVFTYHNLSQIANIEISNLNSNDYLSNEFNIFLANFPNDITVKNIRFPKVDYEFGFFKDIKLKFFHEEFDEENDVKHHKLKRKVRNYRRPFENMTDEAEDIGDISDEDVSNLTLGNLTKSNITIIKSKNKLKIIKKGSSSNKSSPLKKKESNAKPDDKIDAYEKNKFLLVRKVAENGNLPETRIGEMLKQNKEDYHKEHLIYKLSFKKVIEKNAIQKLDFEIIDIVDFANKKNAVETKDFLKKNSFSFKSLSSNEHESKALKGSKSINSKPENSTHLSLVQKAEKKTLGSSENKSISSAKESLRTEKTVSIAEKTNSISSHTDTVKTMSSTKGGSAITVSKTTTTTTLAPTPQSTAVSKTLSTPTVSVTVTPVKKTTTFTTAIQHDNPKLATSASTFVHKSTMYGNGHGNLYGTQASTITPGSNTYTVVKHRKTYSNFTTDLVIVIGILTILFIFLFYVMK